MSQLKFLLGLCIFLVTTGRVHAASECQDAQQTLSGAMSAYSTSGPLVFLNTLAAGGPLEGDTRLKGQVRSLEQIGDFFGPVEGHTVISSKSLGARVCYLHFLLEYENGVAFAVTTMYKMKSGGTAATSFFFKTESESFFPRELYTKIVNSKNQLIGWF